MAMFGSSGRESYDALYDVLQKPADTSAMVREQTPGVFEGSQLGAVGTGLRRAGQRANLAIFDTFGLVEKPAFTALDEFFKTNLEEERQKEREDLLKNFEETKLDPKTNGSAAQLLHGLGDVLGLTAGLALTRNPAIIAGATGTTYGYTQGVAGVQEGLDPVTAYSKGAIEGAAMGVSVALPAAIPGSLALRAATGAAMNVGVGIPERMAVSTLLKARGYSEMAQQYEPFDATSIMTELALGAAFGGLLGPRAKAAKLPKPEAVPPSAVDAALTANQARHAEIDTAPGIPVDTMSRQAHNDALSAMHDAALQGRDLREVNVEPLLRDAGFIGKETDVDAVRVIAEELDKAGVKDLAEQVRSLEAQAKARGLVVDESPMYSRDTPPSGAAHIEVDGTQRPTLDSTGKTIHTTEDGVRNFWRWFGGSKVVDAEGKPLVVYHGTRADVSSFELDAPRARMAFGDAQGFYFTRYSEDAGNYAEIHRGSDGGANVMPVYVRLRNPLVVGPEDGFMASPSYVSPARRAELESQGYDGIIYDGGAEIVAFRPEQIKSAIGNSGTFDKKNQDIRYSRTTAETIRQADAIRNGASRDDAAAEARVLADHPKAEADRIAKAYDKRLREEGEPSPYEAAQPDKIRLLMQAMDDVNADHSAPALTAAFRSMFGKDADRLLDMARLTIVQSVKDLPGSGHPADVGGMFWRGKAYIVADNTGLSQIRGRVLHEIGEHAGMRDMLGDELYKQVLDTVDRKTASDPIFKAARELADARSNKPEHVQAETLAYLVENAPELPVVRRLLAAVRQWLYRVTGGRFVDLTQADLQMMSVASLRRYARQAEIADNGGEPLYQTVFHGSPFHFDKFTLDHIGKGEGAQAYGWGLYFAGKKAIAEFYRENLSKPEDLIRFPYGDDEIYAHTNNVWVGVNSGNVLDGADHIAAEALRTGEDIESAINKAEANSVVIGGSEYNIKTAKEALKIISAGEIKHDIAKGRLYEVEIPDDGEYLLWDRPLSEQPEKVRKAVAAMPGMDERTAKMNAEDDNLLAALGIGAAEGGDLPLMNGRELYDALTKELRSDKAASETLAAVGIKGIKYLDGTSRGAGDGTYNYVLFDDKSIEITQTHYSRDGYPTRESVERFHETANANKAPKTDPVGDTTFPDARSIDDQADAEIASANELSKGFLPAVDCAMRVGT